MKTVLFALIASLTFASAQVNAQELSDSEASLTASKVTVYITNGTAMQGFSPPAVVVHKPSFKLFEIGKPASSAVYKIAEDGVTDDAVALETRPDVYEVVVGKPIPPGETGEIKVSVPYGYQISFASMLATTNDAFLGLSNVKVPRMGYYVEHYSKAMDSGTEANNESCKYVPGAPCSAHLIRMPEGSEGYVHIHRGIQGIADIPLSYGWRNPVAKVKISAD